MGRISPVKGDTPIRLHKRIIIAGIRKMVEAIKKIENDGMVKTSKPANEGTYYKNPTKEQEKMLLKRIRKNGLV